MWQNWEVKTDEIFLIQSTIIEKSREHQALKFIRVMDWPIIVFKLKDLIPVYLFFESWAAGGYYCSFYYKE